jgi:hypothetical protein
MNPYIHFHEKHDGFILEIELYINSMGNKTNITKVSVYPHDNYFMIGSFCL